MNSWAVSACYPQSTFYPLSDGPSIQNHRITMTYFRTCSTCGSRSQARFCHCTLWAMSDRPKRTFVLLRYLLGGDRPSQTAHHARSPIRIHGSRLEPQINQGGISRLAPPKLASRFHSLPPILHRPIQSPMQSYSKGSWGLSVLPRGDCIFTNISTSLSLRRRQCGHRYGQASHPIRPLSCLQSAVFLLNSRSHHFTATPSAFEREALQPTGAHLLPKLRC